MGVLVYIEWASIVQQVCDIFLSTGLSTVSRNTEVRLMGRMSFGDVNPHLPGFAMKTTLVPRNTCRTLSIVKLA